MRAGSSTPVRTSVDIRADESLRARRQLFTGRIASFGSYPRYDEAVPAVRYRHQLGSGHPRVHTSMTMASFASLTRKRDGAAQVNVGTGTT
jgi:hypothetical protein